MFSLEQISFLIEDIFRTELVKQRRDAFAFFDTQTPVVLTDVPLLVREEAVRQVGCFLGFTPSPFNSLEELVKQAVSAYQQGKAVYLSTSGSTGTPKLARHTEEMMLAEAKSVGAHFKTAQRFITLTPRQHLYGLSLAVFFPSVFDIPAVPLPPLPVQPWHTLLKPGDVVAGFPLFWEYFLKAGNTFPSGVTAVTSTAPCPKGLFDRLKQAGAEKVVELYGASETGGIGVRYSEEEPFEINDYWQVDTTSVSPRIHRDGIDGWLDFPDEVRFVPPRAIFPLKRLDAVVQVAGVNVSLKKVEQVLQSHPAVAACRVRLMRPEEGQRLKAFIVLEKGHSEQELPDIRQFLADKLSSHEMPRSFAFGPSLPVNAMGKASDW